MVTKAVLVVSKLFSNPVTEINNTVTVKLVIVSESYIYSTSVLCLRVNNFLFLTALHLIIMCVYNNIQYITLD